jgi:hypothetical protein
MMNYKLDTMRTSILLFATVFIFACGEKKSNKASTDLVNISATADSSKTETNPKEGATIIFEKTEHDFGTITQGEIVEYEFKFKNTGSIDLLISSATASCGCTVPDYPKEPINPGGEGKIKVKFNSDMRIDAFRKEVMVTANTNPLNTTLTIGGIIKAKPQTTLPNSN